MKLTRVVLVAAIVAGPIVAAGPAEAGRTWAKDMGRTWTGVKCVPSPAVEEKSHMEKVIDVEAKPAVEGTPAVEEVSHMEKVIDVPGKPDDRVWWVLKGKNWDGDGTPPADHESWKQQPNLPNENSQHSYPGENGLGNPYQPGQDNGKGDWFRFTGTPAVEEQSHMVKVIDVPGKPAVPGTPAVEEVSHMVKVIDVPGKPAKTCPDVPVVTPPKPKPPVVVPPVTPEPRKNCADVGDNLRSNDPDYRKYLDRDGDGVACEKDVPALPKTGAGDFFLPLLGAGMIAGGLTLRRKFI